MNPETPQTPREQIEVRLTALLLGEVPDPEDAALHELLRHDAALAKLHDSLKQTIDLVRSAAAKQAGPASAQPPLKLSEERRQQLLTQFKTRPTGQKPSVTAKPTSDLRAFFGTRGGVFWKRPARRWLVPVAVAVVVLLVAAISIPNFVRARSSGTLGEGGHFWARLGEQARAAREVDQYSMLARRPQRAAPAVAAATPTPPAVASVPSLESAPPPVTQPRSQIVLPSITESEDPGLNKGAPVATSSKDSWNFDANHLPVAGAKKPADAVALTFDAERREIVALNGEPTEKFSAPSTIPSAPPSDGKLSLQGLTDIRGERSRLLRVPDAQSDSGVAAASQIAPVTGVPVSDLGLDRRVVTATNAVVSSSYYGGDFRNAGKIAGAASLIEDKVPVLGDLPVVGKLLRSESQPSYTSVEQGWVTREAPAAGQRFYRLAPGTGGGGMGGGGGATGASPSPGAPAQSQQVERLSEGPLNLRELTPLPKAETLARSRDGFEVSAAGRIVPKADAYNMNVDALARVQDAAGKALAMTAPAKSPIVLPVPTEPPTSEGAPPNLDWVGKMHLKAGNILLGDGRTQQSSPVELSEQLRQSGDATFANGISETAQTKDARNPTASTAVLDRKTVQAQQEVEKLRKSLAISDADAAGIQPGPLLEAETLRRLKGLQIEAQTEFAKEQKLLEQIKATPPQDLKKVLPKAVPDATLNEYSQQLNLAEQERIRLKKDLSDDNPAVATVTKQIEDLNRKIADRSQGIITGLETRLATSKAYLDSIETDVRKAKEVDIAKSETSRPYYEAKRKLEELQRARSLLADKSAPAPEEDRPVPRPAANAPIPQPEVQTSDNAFSTFSLNVSDVAFKLAAASLEKGQMPDAASVRSEEFINAFDYRDPEPPAGVPVAFAWERARYPFAHNRDLLRFSVKTAAAGRQAGRPLNLVLLLDNSGSMERADRVQIIREALRVLATQLQPQDTVSVITFARTARLWVDGISGSKAGEVFEQVGGLTPQGGTNLEEAMRLAYATALRHYLASGINRVVLLTDGAANLGNVDPDALKQAVETHRKQGIALDCFGIGWEGFNDDLLEVLSRNGDGRYGFINSPEEAADEFAGQLAGALKVAASDVKVQVEFNPARVTAYRQIGYAKHQLTKEQFRDNTVDAAEIAAQEAGNALYTVEANPVGAGPLCTVRCRFKIPGTTDYREHAWEVPFTGNALSLDQASPAMRLAATASAFSEWLVASPFAAEVSPDTLLGYLRGVPEVYGADARPKKLEWMIRQAKSIAGK